MGPTAAFTTELLMPVLLLDKVKHYVVGRHCDSLLEGQPILAGLLRDIGHVAVTPPRIAGLEGNVECGVGGAPVRANKLAVDLERPIDDEVSLIGRTADRPGKLVGGRGGGIISVPRSEGTVFL